MRDYPNIEKSAFRKGEYVGYASGTVWRIRKVGGRWCAAERNNGGLFTRDTLADVSAALETTAAYLLHVKA